MVAFKFKKKNKPKEIQLKHFHISLLISIYITIPKQATIISNAFGTLHMNYLCVISTEILAREACTEESKQFAMQAEHGSNLAAVHDNACNLTPTQINHKHKSKNNKYFNIVYSV